MHTRHTHSLICYEMRRTQGEEGREYTEREGKREAEKKSTTHARQTPGKQQACMHVLSLSLIGGLVFEESVCTLLFDSFTGFCIWF